MQKHVLQDYYFHRGILDYSGVGFHSFEDFRACRRRQAATKPNGPAASAFGLRKRTLLLHMRQTRIRLEQALSIMRCNIVSAMPCHAMPRYAP